MAVDGPGQLDAVIDKMLMLRFAKEKNGEGEGEEKVTSLRNLCARVSLKEETKRNFVRQIVVKETGTNTEETVLCGPSEI